MYFGETFLIRNSSCSDVRKNISREKITPSISFPKNKFFNHCEQFYNNIARVAKDDKFNYILKDVSKKTLKLISKEWFLAAESKFRKDGFVVVQCAKDEKWNFLKTDGTLAFKDSFKKICVIFNNGLAIVQEENEKYSIVRPAYSAYVRKAYYTYICSLNGGYSFLVEDLTRIDYIYNILVKNGEYLYDDWFDLSPTSDLENLDDTDFKFLRAKNEKGLFNVFKPTGSMLYRAWLFNIQDFVPEDTYLYIHKQDGLWYVTDKQGRTILSKKFNYLDYFATDEFLSSTVFAYIENEYEEWNILRLRDGRIMYDVWNKKPLDRFNCYITKVGYRRYALMTFKSEVILDDIIN